MPRRMWAAFSWPVQLPQAAAQGFDFLLVGCLLPLGQFEGFQHFLHVVQGASERLDDMVDFLDRFLDSHWLRGLPLPDWWRGSLPFDRDSFGNGLHRLSGFCRG